MRQCDKTTLATSVRYGEDHEIRPVRNAMEVAMTLTQLFLASSNEAPRARRALEQVPLGRDDWKPHPKSMPLGRLAGLVAGMPSWIG